MRLIKLFVIILSTTGCGDTPSVDSISSILSQNEINFQRTAWNINVAGSGYAIEVYRRCNACIRPGDFFSNYRILTDATGNRILIESLDDEGNVGIVLPDNATYYPNLEQIFDLMDNAILNGTAVFAAFDVDEGYPTRIDFGVDETYIIEVTDYF